MVQSQPDGYRLELGGVQESRGHYCVNPEKLEKGAFRTSCVGVDLAGWLAGWVLHRDH